MLRRRGFLLGGIGCGALAGLKGPDVTVGARTTSDPILTCEAERMPATGRLCVAVALVRRSGDATMGERSGEAVTLVRGAVA